MEDLSKFPRQSTERLKDFFLIGKVRNIHDRIRRHNIRPTGVSERQCREKGARKISEGQMAQNFPELRKT